MQHIHRITASAVLCIMALTWAGISYKLGVMVAVSDNFMYVAGALASVLFGDSITSIANKFSTKER